MRLNATQRGYTRAWRKARREHLAANPWCELCAEANRRTRANTVDHKEPHRGDPVLFWDQNNWQSLCATCHNSVKQSAEHRGLLKGCGADGIPLDAGHHWNGSAA